MPFNHYGVEWCQWTAKPCAEYVRHNDGVYRVKDVPTLPTHPNCRCALSAYWKDDKDNTITTDVNIIRKCLDKYHADFLKATSIDISKSIENETFSDASNPYTDVKAKFINYLLEKKGYNQLPKQVKEYGGAKIYRGIHQSADGNLNADDIDKELKKVNYIFLLQKVPLEDEGSIFQSQNYKHECMHVKEKMEKFLNTD